MGDSERVTIDILLKRETERAWGVQHPNGSRDLIWLPKSQCKLLAESKMDAPEWLLKDRGLI